MKLTPRTLSILGLVALAGILVFAFSGILERRLSEGGIYPAYASFRSDPLGTSALFESLERMEGIQVRRNMAHLNSVQGLDGETAILLLGYPRDNVRDLRAPEDSPVLEAVEEGARLVVTLNPGLVPEVYQPSTTDEEDDWLKRRRELRDERIKERASRPGNDEEDSEKDEEDEELEELEKMMTESLGPTLTDKLGFDVDVVDEFERPEEGWKTEPGSSVTTASVPAAIPDWRSQFHFDPITDDWEPSVLVDGNPVVIEREYGDGTIVIATDTYFVSNEALHSGAEPEFLLWLIGSKPKIVFDETIHGSEETGGAMKLMRRYRIHGIFLGLFVFIALWAWRSASTLAPGSDELDRGLISSSSAVAGEETGSGLIRLLRRSVPAENLLVQCVDSWKEFQRTDLDEQRSKRIAEITERHRADPRNFGVGEAYAAITDLLRKR